MRGGERASERASERERERERPREDRQIAATLGAVSKSATVGLWPRAGTRAQGQMFVPAVASRRSSRPTTARLGPQAGPRVRRSPRGSAGECPGRHGPKSGHLRHSASSMTICMLSTQLPSRSKVGFQSRVGDGPRDQTPQGTAAMRTFQLAYNARLILEILRVPFQIHMDNVKSFIIIIFVHIY